MSTSTVNLTQLRVEAPPRELTPAPRQWTARGVVWIDDTCSFRAGEPTNSLTSPWFDLRDDREYQFELHLALDRAVAVEFGVQDVAGRWVGKVLIDDTVRREHVLSIRDHHADRYRLVLTAVAPLPAGPDLSLGEVDVIASSTELVGRAASRANAADPNTYLPHWGFVRRAIHRACKKSRFINTMVSAAEFRMECEELLSLPQYMALCPTGQCNASCGFCSVTTNRTGIVKRELPFDRLHRFLAPVRNTIRMYGLEGNGEPTLYDHFDDLIDILAAGGATFYLITNAERLTTEQVDRVIARGVSAVNVSLNAATAATHRSVMRLKHFDRVIENVKRFTTVRSKENTTVSVSYVVNRHNIHEVVDFIRLADRELNVDHIYVRTLSEIANDQGVVEDQRDLVPHESEVRDMLERVGDYLRLEPVRAIMHFKPETFRAFRSDPAGRIVKPPGYETRLLAPRPSGWSAEREDVRVDWSLDAVSLSAPASAINGDSVLIRSAPLPVDPSIEETFRCRATVRSGLLRMAIVDETGREFSSRSVGPSAMDLPSVIEFALPRGVELVRVVIGCGPGGVNANVDFERLLVPGHPIHSTFRLPEPRRWEVSSPGAGVVWTGAKVHVTWEGPASQYLLKSFSQPCRPNEPIALPVMLNVRRGKLGVGVLSADFTRWTHQFEFDAGTRAAILRIDPVENDRVQFVLYATTADGLDADIDWGDNITVPRQSGVWTASVKPPVPELSPAPSSSSAASGLASAPTLSSPPKSLSTPLPHRSAAALGNLLASIPHFFKRKPRAAKARYYCQKPWTDLSNFSVDGRMDVCCIATGESQKRYAWGNIFEQTFQEIWNGPVAREFRRTVNHADKALPPCARCPMAYQYQGPMFDPVYTPQWVRGWLAMSSERRWLRRPIMAVGIVTYRLVHPLLFRGFKKI